MTTRRGSDWIVLARLRRPRGREGELLAEIHTDWPELRFQAGSEYELRWDDGRSTRLSLTGWRETGQGALLSFEGVTTIDGAQRLAGAWLGVDADSCPAPPGEVRQADLIGLVAQDPEGRVVGEVVQVEDGVASDLLLLRTGDGREVLVPACPPICAEVDLAGGRIVLDPPPGLLDPEASETVPEDAA